MPVGGQDGRDGVPVEPTGPGFLREQAGCHRGRLYGPVRSGLGERVVHVSRGEEAVFGRESGAGKPVRVAEAIQAFVVADGDLPGGGQSRYFGEHPFG